MTEVVLTTSRHAGRRHAMATQMFDVMARTGGVLSVCSPGFTLTIYYWRP